MAYCSPHGFPKCQRSSVEDSVDKASMKILKELFQSSKDKNVITSPLGVLTLLSMFSAGAEGKTREEIMQLLGFTNYKQLEEAYGSLSKKFSSTETNYLVLANRMYVSDRYTLNDQFSNIARESYKSEVKHIDFRQKHTVADSINKWAEEKTKGLIKSPVDEQTIDEAAVVALFNVIFFKGDWLVSFKANNTEMKDFYVDESKTIKKPMMKLKHSLYYYNDGEIGARMVELPYKEKDFRMVVVLPVKKDGLAEVIERLAHKGILDNVCVPGPSRRRRVNVDLEMPKFEIKSSLGLNDILRKVGVEHMFSEGALGVVRERAVTVSKVFQEAFVKVDEKGSIAGAFTGCVVLTKSLNSVPPPPVEFKVDHPFLFTILHEDIILFAGCYTH